MLISALQPSFMVAIQRKFTIRITQLTNQWKFGGNVKKRGEKPNFMFNRKVLVIVS